MPRTALPRYKKASEPAREQTTNPKESDLARTESAASSPPTRTETVGKDDKAEVAEDSPKVREGEAAPMPGNPLNEGQPAQNSNLSSAPIAPIALVPQAILGSLESETKNLTPSAPLTTNMEAATAATAKAPVEVATFPSAEGKATANGSSAPIPPTGTNAPNTIQQSVPPEASSKVNMGKDQPIPEPKAFQSLSQANPKVQLSFQFSEGTPERQAPIVSTMPALREFLSLPKPEMEVPQPSNQAFRSQLGKNSTASQGEPPPAQATSTAPTSSAAPEKAGTAAGDSSVVLTKSASEAVLPSQGAPIPTNWVPGTLATTVKAMESVPTNLAPSTLMQVQGAVHWLIKNQEKGAEIQLNPEALGRVVIKLHIEGSEVHARLWASEAGTVSMLQDQKASLETSLRQQGLSLGSFDLHHGHRGHDTPSAPQQGRMDSGAKFADSLSGKQEVPTNPLPVLNGARLIEVFA